MAVNSPILAKATCSFFSFRKVPLFYYYWYIILFMSVNHYDTFIKNSQFILLSYYLFLLLVWTPKAMELLPYMSDDKRNIAIFHVLIIPRVFLKAHTVFRWMASFSSIWVEYHVLIWRIFCNQQCSSTPFCPFSSILQTHAFLKQTHQIRIYLLPFLLLHLLLWLLLLLLL